MFGRFLGYMHLEHIFSFLVTKNIVVVDFLRCLFKNKKPNNLAAKFLRVQVKYGMLLTYSQLDQI